MLFSKASLFLIVLASIITQESFFFPAINFRTTEVFDIVTPKVTITVLLVNIPSLDTRIFERSSLFA